jgi:tetratricopeptide (TPR) repeat protein
MCLRMKPGALVFLRIVAFHLVLANGFADGSSQPAEAASHNDKGLQLAQAGDLLQAEAELRMAVHLAPDSAQFLANLGTILAMERKLDDSTTVFKRALKLGPSDSTTRRYLAANLWQLHRYAEARRNLELILKDQPDDEPTRLLLGMVSENMTDYATAIRMFASVPAQVRQRPESIAALARSYYRTGAKEKAQSTLRELLTHPAGAQGVFLGSQIADEMKDYATAEMLLASTKPDASDQPALGYRLALVQYHAEQFEDSERTLLNLITSGYKTSQILNLLGWCHEKQNQPTEAARVLDEAISLDPGQESNYLDLAKILLGRHSLPAALDAAKRATSALPGSSGAFLMRGAIELKMSQFTDAIASYTRVLHLEPANPDGNLGLAEAQSAAGLSREASAGFVAGIKRFPKDSRFQVQFALMLLKEAETGNAPAEARAEQLLKSALTLDRSLPEVHYQLGNLALRRGRAAEALPHLEQAAKLDPKGARIHFALSSAYRRLGRPDAASHEMALYQRLKESETKESETKEESQN